jgi:galactokinase
VIDSQMLASRFQDLYGRRPRVWSAPGRVNLIGEHTDYNEGFVLPAAIDLRTYVAAAPRADRLVSVNALNLGEESSFDLDRSAASAPGHWLAYIEGVARVLEGRGIRLVGADMAVASEVPIGAGLSSSAALEISIGTAFLELSGTEMEPLELAVVAQIAEHSYAGTKCGLMDQITSVLGQRHHALLIDCRSLDVTPLPLNMPGVTIVVCNTKVQHKLSSSLYNTRRAECGQGMELLRKFMPEINALRDVSAADFQLHENRLPETIRKRCRHVVAENTRTLAAAEAIISGEIEELGRLMLLSHESLRDDFEVSCHELDVAVGIASSCDGVVGARMMGGGFGGSTVNLVDRDAIDYFRETMIRDYHATFGFDPDIYLIETADGICEVTRGPEPGCVDEHPNKDS